ncbi:MAG: EAL domain-containing protein, partial [Halobacteria archaeon]|nr:EAL domain-containing protein [Halobacteria archaeon]
ILLDNFKAVREDIGINGSDKVLRDAATLIAASSGENDTVARFSDYVFVVLHRGEDINDAQKFAEKMLHDIDGHVYEVEGNSVMIKSSIGVCPVSGHTNTAQDVITRADLACEVAQSSEGTRIHFHNVAVDDQMSQDHEGEWDAMVRKTLEEKRFYLVYQPIVSLNGDTRERYEVLLRILDHEGQVVLPSQFLSIADEIGLTHEIDRWVIDNAMSALAELHRADKDTTFFVKISGKTLADIELPLWIHEKIRECQVKTENIVFEITEDVALKDLRNAMHFVNAVHKLGCKVALEHYGRANQPQLLKHLSVDILKIDGSLIENLSTSKENQATIKSIIEAANSQDIKCTAECVEEAHDLGMLWQYGVEFVQGNFAQIPSKKLDYDFAGDSSDEESTIYM